jgi:type II secretory ATPase GspE/PulE/Tfp pilus assembly ATPase PilB-like protein
MAHHPVPVTLSQPLTLYKPVGCKICHDTGYKGRLGIFEAVLMDKAVEEVVIRDPREHLILEAARPQGIPTMTEDGAEKVLRGDTSFAELERVIELPKVTASTSSTPDNPPSDNPDLFLSHVIS